MSEVKESESPNEVIQSGLRILARIIAREEVINQLIKMDCSDSIFSVSDTTTAEDNNLIKGALVDEKC